MGGLAADRRLTTASLARTRDSPAPWIFATVYGCSTQCCFPPDDLIEEQPCAATIFPGSTRITGEVITVNLTLQILQTVGVIGVRRLGGSSQRLVSGGHLNESKTSQFDRVDLRHHRRADHFCLGNLHSLHSRPAWRSLITHLICSTLWLLMAFPGLQVQQHSRKIDGPITPSQ